MKDYLKQINEVIDKGEFKDNWDSLSNYRVPDWYRKLKFGIFIHWGIFSVPAFNNEWYSRNMYIQGTPEFEHHVKTYGEHKNFGYKDFIPMFTMEKFQPEEWAKLFKQAGARYVIPVAEHHDGFQMYQSELSHWNACEMGPKRNVLGDLGEAVRQEGLTFGNSTHRVEHWFFMSHGKEFDSDIKEPLKRGDFYWPSMKEYGHHDLFSPAPTQEYLEDWLCRCCELIDLQKPRIVYFDWWIQHSAVKPYLKKFAAYYYNRAREWGEEVVINYKHDSFQFGCAVVDIERGQFAEAKPYYWQTDTAVARNSWCYTATNDYKPAEEIICDLVDIVSKNGTLLLNVGPKSDGTIPEEDKSILLKIGAWLSVNGEAIYDTHIWRLSGEGPTKVVEGQFADGTAKHYTGEDIRFTVRGTYLYAAVLAFPEDGAVRIKSLADRDASKLPHFHGIIKEVTALGFEDGIVSWKRDEEALRINTRGINSSYPVVFRILVD